MTPTYGQCRDCAAWTRYTYDETGNAGCCRRCPVTTAKDAAEGCWMHVGKIVKDAFWDASRLDKPSHEAMEDVNEKGEVDGE